MHVRVFSYNFISLSCDGVDLASSGALLFQLGNFNNNRNLCYLSDNRID